MHIAAERHGDVGVSKNGTEAFHVKSHFHAPCGEGMAQGMEIRIRDSSVLEYTFEMPLHSPRLHDSFLVPGKQKAFAFFD